MRTRLTDLLEIEHPVMLAGMGGVSYHRLVAAVSGAGGFGCLGASTMGPDQMVAEMSAVKELTDKPFGVDLLTAASRDMAAQVRLIIEAGARVFVAGLGVPRDVIDLCHSHECGLTDWNHGAMDGWEDVAGSEPMADLVVDWLGRIDADGIAGALKEAVRG